MLVFPKQKKTVEFERRRLGNNAVESSSESDEGQEMAPIDTLAQADAYYETGEFKKARAYYKRHLKLSKITNDVVGMAMCFGRIGL